MRENMASGFQSLLGARNHDESRSLCQPCRWPPCCTHGAHSYTPRPARDGVPRDPVVRQAAIENALTMALYFVRLPDSNAANLWAATARANRALTLLKHAGQANTPAGSADALGRA